MSANTRSRRARWARRIVLVTIGVLGAAHAHQASAATPAKAQVDEASVASAGDQAAGRVLGGLTAQKLPVLVTVSSNGKHIGTQVVFNMQCTSGDSFLTPDGWVSIPVAASGNVHATTALSPLPGSATEDAITGGEDTMSGKLNRKRATFSGVWELQINYASSSGQADSCDSGRVSFTVRL
jgi:hypothetical protein